MCNRCVLPDQIPVAVCPCKCRTDVALPRMELKLERKKVYCSDCHHRMAYP